MLTEDGKCECAPCPPASCQLGHRPVQVRPALDRETPGSCCPLYECRLAGNFFLINRALFSSDRETIRETRPSLHWHPSIPVELLRICRYSGERVVEDRARMRPPRSKLDGIRFGIRLRFTRDVSTGTIRRWQRNARSFSCSPNAIIRRYVESIDHRLLPRVSPSTATGRSPSYK